MVVRQGKAFYTMHSDRQLTDYVRGDVSATVLEDVVVSGSKASEGLPHVCDAQ